MNAPLVDKAFCRIGIDVGGTFTDLVLANRKTGKLTFFKQPSTPSEPSEAVEKGIAGILKRAGVQPDAVELIIHGTTLGLNAIIQRRGARMALVVSPGNRDIFEIGRGRISEPFNLMVEKEIPLIPRSLVMEVPARVQADGTVRERPSQESLAELVERLKRADVDAVAVMLLNSYLHPELERQVAAALREGLPGVLITESAEIWPEVREYERALVGALNAYINPLLEKYLTRLQQRIDSLGVSAPIYITSNNGGTLGLPTARQRPIDTILSGPASGVVASSALADLSDVSKVITFDMGGTSSDMAVSDSGRPEYTTRTMVGDFPLILPVVNVSAIGAGGGSIISVDRHGVLKVGPASAGAEPGPICYSRGGTLPTVTDCYLTLNMIREDGFLGGAMRLDRASAVRALEEIGKRLGFTGDDIAQKAAEASLLVATSRMSTDIYKAFAQRGLVPQEFILAAYGGAGPTHANLLAKEARLKAILIPPSPGTLCAFGALVADLRRDFVRTVQRRIELTPVFKAHLAGLAAAIRAEADEWLAQEGAIVGPVEVHWTADLRYLGEASEINIRIPEGAIEEGRIGEIAEAYHVAHDLAYEFRDDDHIIEMLNLRAQVVAQVPPLKLPEIETGSAVAPKTRRPVFSDGRWIEADVHARSELLAGVTIKGPAIIEQEDTTSWILPGWQGVSNASGIVIVTRSQA